MSESLSHTGTKIGRPCSKHPRLPHESTASLNTSAFAWYPAVLIAVKHRIDLIRNSFFRYA